MIKLQATELVDYEQSLYLADFGLSRYLCEMGVHLHDCFIVDVPPQSCPAGLASRIERAVLAGQVYPPCELEAYHLWQQDAFDAELFEAMTVCALAGRLYPDARRDDPIAADAISRQLFQAMLEPTALSGLDLAGENVEHVFCLPFLELYILKQVLYLCQHNIANGGIVMGWDLYDRLIEGIPEDVLVRDYCLGVSWSYVEAESGAGISYTCRGGATKHTDKRDFRGLPLREMAALSKSWCFEEATLGIAAMNAWYGQRRLVDAMGAVYDEPVELPDGSVHKIDAFELMRLEIEARDDASVVVVGHFPHVDRIEEYARLTVLERNCRAPLDVPDPACEYILPSADYAFITGVTLENKTAPRLLELSQNAFVTMVGPSVVMSRSLLDAGVDMAAGSIVLDPERVAHSVKSGGGMSFGGAIQMVAVYREPTVPAAN